MAERFIVKSGERWNGGVVCDPRRNGHAPGIENSLNGTTRDPNLVEEEREEDNWLSEGDRRPLADPGDLRVCRSSSDGS